MSENPTADGLCPCEDYGDIPDDCRAGYHCKVEFDGRMVDGIGPKKDTAPADPRPGGTREKDDNRR